MSSPRSDNRLSQSLGLPRSSSPLVSVVDESKEPVTPSKKSSRGYSVHAFLKTGEQNRAFSAKAPSILGGGDNDNDRLRDLNTPLLSATSPTTSMRSPSLQSIDVTSHTHEEDFQTVDWSRDRDMYLHEKGKVSRLSDESTGCKKQLIRAWNASQGWLICLIVGMTTGAFAALIDIAVHWSVDLKIGYCERDWWLGYSFCCHTSSDIVSRLGETCPSWISWKEAIETSLPSYWVEFGMYVLMGGSMATICAWLVQTFAPYARGSGIPEVKTILGGVVIKGYLGLWTLLIKMIGLVLSVGSGLSLGKEGPYVHVASCLANIYSRWFPKYQNNEAKKNEVISAAAAAGVSVAFGAPIGGVLFSLEEVSTYFPHKTMWRAFFCAIIAALTLQYIDPTQTGKLVLFQISYTYSWHWFEMIPFALIGIVGGMVGVLFIRLNLMVSRVRMYTALGKHPILEVAFIIFFTCVISFQTDFLRGSDNSVLAALFHECDPRRDPLDLCDVSTATRAILNLFLTAVATLTMTVFTFGSSVPAGLFIPSMVTGACLGRIVGTMMRVLHHENPDSGLFSDCSNESVCITPGIYALVGAAAVLGGVTRMTVSLVVIMFELTGGLEYILPIMVAIISSKWVGDAFGKGGVYDEYIRLNEYPFLESLDHVDMVTTAQEVMKEDLVVLTMHGHTVYSLYEQLNLANQLRINGFPVVTTHANMLVVGYITKQELLEGLKTALERPEVSETTPCYFGGLDAIFGQEVYVDMSKFMHPTPIQVVETTPLHRIYNIFKQLGLRYCLVTRFGRVLGIITKKDILKYLDAQDAKHHPNDEHVPNRIAKSYSVSTPKVTPGRDFRQRLMRSRNRSTSNLAPSGRTRSRGPE